MKSKAGQLELYVHIPFCIRKCQYCDFLSGPSDRKTRESYVKALIREICASAEGEKREVCSVFIGGGTPSVLEEEWIAEIMDCIRTHFSIAAGAEITMEANPGTVTEQKLRICRESGINRLSLGLQSTEQNDLRMLGRIHTWEDFRDSFLWARNAGFSNINVDLMFAIPGQDCEKWSHSLRKTVELRPEHISAYSLIIEEGTPFGEHLPESLPDEETEYRMYEDTAAILREYGYQQYEISNYALPGYECRHNVGYWNRREYLGLGLGAASLYQGLRFFNTKDMNEYLTDSGNPQKIRKEVTCLSKNDAMEEFMFLGLRMTKGISEKEFLKQFGCEIDSIYGKILEKYRAEGFLQKNGDFWSFTRKGIHVSNYILADFLLDQ